MPCLEYNLLRGAPRRPLLEKEMREFVFGRGFWAALVISVLLSGYSYVQAADDALRFVLANPAVSSVVVGALRLEHMRSNLMLAKQIGSL